MAAAAINTRKMRYTGGAMRSLKHGNLNPILDFGSAEEFSSEEPFTSRDWFRKEHELRPPNLTDQVKHKIGRYPLTSKLASWVIDAFVNYRPSGDAVNLVRPFAAEFHGLLEKERANSTGFHDLNLVELTYQVSIEVAGEILIAATRNGDAADLEVQYHSSHAARDEHFVPWGRLLTGLDCEPPIISQFPFYLMMCQAFSFEANSSRENYVYSALTGVDWAKGKNAYSDRFQEFEDRARAAVPLLDDKLSGEDRSFWRIALGYLSAVNKTENAKEFSAPRSSHIKTNMDPYVLMAARAFDTIGSAFMCSDGAAYHDNAGMDSQLGSALPNDIMDLHMDIMTGETRNLLRLLYPNGQTMKQAIQSMATAFSGMLCEVFRGHKRARFDGREDGRISATSPPYSFCRSGHRRIFETMEAYITKYPDFWNWVWDIYDLAKTQITEAGLDELLVGALYRSINQTPLPDSKRNHFFDTYFELIENGNGQLQAKDFLGVKGELSELLRELYSLWHDQLLAGDKKVGWGREFDIKSDALLGQAGEILSAKGGINDEVYKFAIAYGRLSMGLPYIAYHAIDAIILVHGVVHLPAS
jgi:hypothetical protein